MNSETQLNFFDLFWYRAHTPSNQMVINLVLDIEGDIAPSKVYEQMDTLVQQFSRFRSRVVGTTWVPIQNFKLTDYITEVQLKEPTDGCLQELFDDKISEPMIFCEKSPWSMYIVSNVPFKGLILFWKVHHCITDGGGLNHMMKKVVKSPPQVKKAPDNSINHIGKPTIPQKLAKFTKSAVYFPVHLLNQWMLLVGLIVKLNAILLLGDSKTAIRVRELNGRKVTARLLDFATVNEIKSIGKNMGGGTVNDVLCSLASGAIRRYVQTHGTQQNKLNSLRINVAMPIDLRKPTSPSYLENHFALLWKSLPVKTPTIYQRVRSFHLEMQRVKQGYESLVSTIILRGMAWLPLQIFHRLLWFWTRRASVVITNVPWSFPQPAEFAGGHLKRFYGWVPTSGSIGVGVAYMSLEGKVGICLSADVNITKDLAPLKQAFIDEWADMKSSPQIKSNL